MTKGKKPYFIGEFGFVDTPHLGSVYDTTIARRHRRRADLEPAVP